jgi:hypothetical protein
MTGDETWQRLLVPRDMAAGVPGGAPRRTGGALHDLFAGGLPAGEKAPAPWQQLLGPVRWHRHSSSPAVRVGASS